MVGHTIQASAWAHNCGMHVIADYLIEKIQKKQFEKIFIRKSYDALLASFRETYKQDSLSWAQLRETSLRSSRENGQIIWGVALRRILPEIIKNNIEYKSNLFNQFLSLINLIRLNKYKEAYESYPFLLAGNFKYLEGLKEETEYLKQVPLIASYFEKTGFEEYCKATLKKQNDPNLYLWLSIDEIKICADFLNIKSICVNHKPKARMNLNKLYFFNIGNHWERKGLASQVPTVLSQKSDLYFKEHFLDAGIEKFEAHIEQIGKIYFSDLYLDSTWHVESVERLMPLEQGVLTKIEKIHHFEENISFETALSKSFDFLKKNPGNKEAYLQYQKVLFSKVKIAEAIILKPKELEIIKTALEQSFAEWLHHLVAFLNKNTGAATELSDSNISVLEMLSKNACDAISTNDAFKLTTCLIVDNRCLVFPGKYNPAHHAFQNGKIEFLKTVVVDFVVEYYPKADDTPESKLYIESIFSSLIGPAKDKYDRSLDFRMDRACYLSELRKKLAEAKTLLERLKLRGKIFKYYIGEIRIKLVDHHHEKSKHNAKIQSKHISKLGRPLMLAFRSIGVIANGGLIRFGLEMGRTLVPNFVQLPFIYVGGKVASYVGDKMGYESAYAEEYTKLAMSNLISFALMPHYYVASTVLNGVVYYTFKDRGYDNLEALCLLASERVALGSTSSQQGNKQIKTEEAYQYQLNKNLTPIVGEYAASYISPVITMADNSNQQFDKFLTDNTIAISENFSQYYSQSAMASISSAMGNFLSHPIQLLEQLQHYNNSWMEKGFNFIEGNALHYLMNDSKFKNERMHAIQLSNTDRFQQSYFGLKKQSEEQTVVLNEINLMLNKEKVALTELQNNPNTPDEVVQQQKLVVNGFQERFNSQQLSLNKLNDNMASELGVVNKAIELSEELYKKTEGFSFQEKYKDAYFSYKYSLVKPNKNVKETEKLLKEAEQALVDSKFYNTNKANQIVETWAKSVDDLFVRYSSNFPDWRDPAHVIGSIVNEGFKTISDRNQLAKFLADEIIRLKNPLYPEMGDKTEIEAERNLLIHEISTDELSG